MLTTTTRVPKAVTPEMYQTILEELDTVTAQLKKTRESLWETQDKVKDAEDKAKALELHVEELVQNHQTQDEEIKKLRAENSTHIEEEVKVRESLELMKKVFTRNQLKAREDQETLMLLQEERDLLLEENKHLRNSSGTTSKHEKDAIQRIKRESLEKERHLTSILEKVKAELTHTRSKYKTSEESIRALQKRLASVQDSEETKNALAMQQRKISRLEYEIEQLHEQEQEREEDEEDDIQQRDEISNERPRDASPMEQFANQLSFAFMGLK